VTQPIFESKVEGLTFKGLGVVRHPEGRVVFVRDVWPGDEGVFETISLEKRFGFAKLKELKKPSVHRRKAPCPHLGENPGQCGGCPWMIADYNSQLVEKQKIVLELSRRGGVLPNDGVLKPIIGSPKEFAYRNRAQFKTDGESVGYVSVGTNTLAPVDHCMILNEKCQELLRDIRYQLPNKNWRPKKEDWSFIDIDDETTQIVANKRRPFRQANTEQNEKMKAWVKNKIADKNKSVIELFCGSGNFTGVFVENGFSDVTAVEGSRDAIENLLKKFPKVKALDLDLLKPQNFKKIKFEKAPEILFLDPPRDGFENLDLFLKEYKSIKEIFYVSCDLSTFIRDTKKAIELGFEVREIQPIDQFPQTPHIEILAHLKAKI
jgi:23S rRNA (uracil1939-C5)-methyltransferase